MAASPRPPVVLVTGPSAAGKSTVAGLLATRFPRGVHLEGDVFRRSILSGREEITPDASVAALEQLRLRYRLAAAAADAYAEQGFAVILDDVVAGPVLLDYVQLVRSRPLHVVVLLPQVDALAARDAARDQKGYALWTPDQLHRVFADETPRVGLWLDTSEESPEQTVDAIVEAIATGRSRVAGA